MSFTLSLKLLIFLNLKTITPVLFEDRMLTGGENVISVWKGLEKVAESVFPLLSLTETDDMVFSKTDSNYPFVGSPNWIGQCLQPLYIIFLLLVSLNDLPFCVPPLRWVTVCPAFNQLWNVLCVEGMLSGVLESQPRFGCNYHMTLIPAVGHSQEYRLNSNTHFPPTVMK